MKLGFNKDLMILAFDHRGSFQKKMFGIDGAPNAEQTEEISSYKKIIYDGFKKAVEMGVPKEKAGILVDEQFGSDILNDAKNNGFQFACPAEKSGQNEFDFEYGSEYGAHIHKFQPSFVKVLVRYNTDDDAEMNKRQAARLKELGEYCHSHDCLFLFELLVPAVGNQLDSVDGDKARYDKELRPDLMISAIHELQKAGVEPDIWKLEGIDSAEDAARVKEACQRDGRSEVGTVILGRGENDQKVREWLSTAAKVDGFIGFAVGRTIFWEPLKGFREGKWSRDDAVERVAQNYKGFYDVWESARN